MKTGVRTRYFNKFKARHKNYLAGKYRTKGEKIK
tara:strand:+ start:2351 stop:2452 length:102 start_codon:yes stop_codon:yes gene_type:complete